MTDLTDRLRDNRGAYIGVPHFFATNKAALEDIKRCAEAST